MIVSIEEHLTFKTFEIRICFSMHFCYCPRWWKTTATIHIRRRQNTMPYCWNIYRRSAFWAI